VTAFNPRTGQKGTVGVGWLKDGAEGTYLSLSLLPFVVLDGAQDVMITIFERDHRDRRAAKEERLNRIKEPCPGPTADDTYNHDYAAYLKWAVDLPGCLSLAGFKEAHLAWARHLEATGTFVPLREWMAAATSKPAPAVEPTTKPDDPIPF
jgi:hypothetical protein